METFTKRYIVERTSKAEIRPEEQSCWENLWMKCSWKGHKDWNRHHKRIKRSGQAWLVYVKDINCNIPNTGRWARGDISYKCWWWLFWDSKWQDRQKSSTVFESRLYRMSGHQPSIAESAPQWGAEDTEIKVPSVENTELKSSPFRAWSRSVCSRTCYAYWQGFLPY